MGSLFKNQSIINYHSVASMSDMLRSHIDAGAREGTIVLASEQRNNYLPHGGLWFSFYVEPVLKKEELPLIPLICSLAIADTLKSVAGIRAQIKWPKEVVVNGRRIADVHCDIEGRSLSGLHMTKALISCAINTNIDFAHIPEKSHDTITSVALERAVVNHENMMVHFCKHFEEYYSLLHKNSKEDLLGKYCDLLTTLNKEVVVTTNTREESGKAVAIDDDGSLLFRTNDGALKKVSSSDVLFGNALN